VATASDRGSASEQAAELSPDRRRILKRHSQDFVAGVQFEPFDASVSVPHAVIAVEADMFPFRHRRPVMAVSGSCLGGGGLLALEGVRVARDR
jgi:hypothetical protein